MQFDLRNVKSWVDGKNYMQFKFELNRIKVLYRRRIRWDNVVQFDKPQTNLIKLLSFWFEFTWLEAPLRHALAIVRSEKKYTQNTHLKSVTLFWCMHTRTRAIRNANTRWVNAICLGAIIKIDNFTEIAAATGKWKKNKRFIRFHPIPVELRRCLNEVKFMQYELVPVLKTTSTATPLKSRDRRQNIISRTTANVRLVQWHNYR